MFEAAYAVSFLDVGGFVFCLFETGLVVTGTLLVHSGGTTKFALCTLFCVIASSHHHEREVCAPWSVAELYVLS